MKWYWKIQGGHTHVRVFMNGGKCGDLVFRNAEFQQVQNTIKGAELIDENPEHIQAELAEKARLADLEAKHALLTDMHRFTFYSLRHSTDDEILISTIGPIATKYAAMVTHAAPPPSRLSGVLIYKTEHVFDTEDEAKAYMRKVVETCRELEEFP